MEKQHTQKKIAMDQLEEFYLENLTVKFWQKKGNVVLDSHAYFLNRKRLKNHKKLGV